jgi:Tol biopolymer transport system component
MKRRPRLLFPLVVASGLFFSACNASGSSDSLGAPPGTTAIERPLGQVEQIEPPTFSAPTETPSAPGPIPTTAATRVPTATQTPVPIPRQTPTVTPTPIPLLLQLGEGGCCTQPSWSPDSARILYIDRPDSGEPAGVWALSIDDPLQPFLYLDRIGLYTDDLRYLVDSDGQTTTIERLPDPSAGDLGERWQVPAGGRPVSFSPRRTRIAWQVSNNALAVETRMTEIWIANLDGTEPRSVASLPRGGLAGWISDDVLLLTGRESLATAETIFWSYSLSDGSMVELARGERLRQPVLSPDGRWLVYYETFGDPQQNGLWAVRTDGSRHVALPSDLFGAYQWRDSERLLIIPFKPDAHFHELWEYNVEEETAQELTDPTVTPFNVANGDWRVSPDGRHIAFVESRDHNIWLLTIND